MSTFGRPINFHTVTDRVGEVPFFVYRRGGGRGGSRRGGGRGGRGGSGDSDNFFNMVVDGFM